MAAEDSILIMGEEPARGSKNYKMRINRQVFNELDYREEQGSLRKASELKKVEEYLHQKYPERQSSSAAMSGTIEKMTIESTYVGPRLPRPLNLKSIHSLLSHFRKGGFLHKKYVLQILYDFRALLEQSPNVQELPIREKMTVCGDLHGQLEDLFTIWHKNGYPAPDNGYLFNGDFVDRGPCSVEVFLSLCAWKIVFPTSMFLNRGNHESRALNNLYGFQEEVVEKYDMQTYEYFQSVFSLLPICSVIQGAVFVVHGGLPRAEGTTLDQIRRINRNVDDPESDPLYQDLLWSDPLDDDKSGILENHRGAGVMFGADMTKSFLKNNRLKYMIRSHEVKDNGFDIVHGRRCITIFSASNYGGSYDNKGAYIVLKSDLVPHIHTFMAGTKKESAQEEDEEEAAEKLAAMNLNILKDLICLHRQQLLDQFMAQDKSSIGRVSQAAWANVLKLVIKLDIPWHAFLSNLANLETDGTINYRLFLARYKLHLAEEYASWEVEVIDRIQERIFSSRQSLEETFKKFDLDGNATLSFEEFVKAMATFDLGLSQGQVKELMKSMDSNGDGQLDFNEFISRFELVYVKEPPPDLSPDVCEFCERIIKQLGRYFMDNGWTLSQAFAQFDADGNGTISFAEFKNALDGANIRLRDSELRNLIHFIDTDNNSR
eukprot:TRINITY_DN2328_c0_g1_i2.p1 TRINITY_DN2328_c0_g1~~TRINITY_DN2328_c0_g1_i2.p1  ORF type:complete len:659 (+),score=129.79 TRINITY_DN2328_c0_g1_i2:86-2062(+)